MKLFNQCVLYNLSALIAKQAEVPETRNTEDKRKELRAMTHYFSF